MHYEPSEPFTIDGKDVYDTVLVDNKHHISYSEYKNGYAEIDGDIVKLSEHQVESIERQNEDGYFFIGTIYHCILSWKNDGNVQNFIQRLKDNDGKLDIEEIQKFEWEVRKHKFPEVLMRL